MTSNPRSVYARRHIRLVVDHAERGDCDRALSRLLAAHGSLVPETRGPALITDQTRATTNDFGEAVETFADRCVCELPTNGSLTRGRR